MLECVFIPLRCSRRHSAVLESSGGSRVIRFCDSCWGTDVDLTKLTDRELKNLLKNNQRHGQHDTVRAVLMEMDRRGVATRRDYRTLTWNQDSVREIMRPFKEVADAVPGNQRTSYTEAGGRKIGRAKTDPERRWIDTYSAIKTASTNAVIVCYVKSPGDEPEFQLRIDDAPVLSFNADRLSDALKQWKEVAEQAVS
jgi:hypothetical protein